MAAAGRQRAGPRRAGYGATAAVRGDGRAGETAVAGHRRTLSGPRGGEEGGALRVEGRDREKKAPHRKGVKGPV